MNMDDYFRFQREIQKMIEQAAGVNHLRFLDAEVRKAIQPLREPYTALDRAVLDAMQPRDLAKEAIAAAIPTGSQLLFEMMERQRLQYDGYLDLARGSRSATAQLFEGFRRTTADRLRELVGEAAFPTVLQREVAGVREMALGLRSPSASAALATALDGWTNVLRTTDDDLLTSAFANPLATSAQHFRESAAMLAAGPKPDVARAIERAVLLADVELRATSDALVQLTTPTVELDTVEPPARRLYVPRLQRIELRRAAAVLEFDADADLDDLLATIPIGQAVLVAREVLALFNELVAAQQGSNRPAIFKVTARVTRACAELPFGAPVDEPTFADFIDDLYFLLYESPGAKSLRYLAENGGPFTRADCETVFVIKLLRNYYRHDLEHGADREIEKKFEDVREILRARGVEHPRTRNDYRALHRVLLEEVASFLRKLRKALH